MSARSDAAPVRDTIFVALKMGGRQFWRELIAGRMRVLFAAVVLAVLGVSTVSIIAERVRGALLQQAGQLLGGDLVLRADQIIAPELQAEFASSGPVNAASAVAVARTAEFPSTIRTLASDGAISFKLVEVKAASANFPLRGAYILRGTDAAGLERAVGHAPELGEVWIAERLQRELDLKLGATLNIGAQAFKVAGIILREPDIALDYSAIAPRVLIRIEDLAATKLEQPGARIGYRLIAAGTPAQMQGLSERIKPLLSRGQRLESVRDARPELRAGLDRAEQFLGLSLLAALTLSATALALAAWRFSQQQIDTFAVLRTLGASTKTLLLLVLTQLLLLAISATIAGLVLAELTQRLVAFGLAASFATVLPAAGYWPWLQGFAVALVMLLGFAAPLLIRLRHVPAVRVLSRQANAPDISSRVLLTIGFTALLSIGVLLVGDIKIASYTLAGLVLAMLLLALAALAMLAVLRALRPRVPLGVALSLAGVLRRAKLNVLSITAIGLSLTALMLMTLLRTDLLDQWQLSSAPECGEVAQAGKVCSAPNRFLINVQDDQRDALSQALTRAELGAVELWPMLRGRFTAVNGSPYVAPDPNDVRAKRMAEREFNLSVSTNGLPEGNSIVSGRYFQPNSNEPSLSVEEGLATTLGWKLNDVIRFDLGGVIVEAPITSLRKVQWDNFKPNFFVLLNQAAWQNLPASWIASLRVTAAQSAAFERALRPYPNVSVIDLDFVQRQVRDIIRQVSRAVELVFWFTLLSGLLVLAGAISATQQERRFDAGVMRVLGARSGQLLRFDAVEFALIGAIAGLIACASAVAMTSVIAANVFEFQYAPNWPLVTLGVALSVVLVLVIGLAGTRGARASAPSLSLREAT